MLCAHAGETRRRGGQETAWGSGLVAVPGFSAAHEISPVKKKSPRSVKTSLLYFPRRQDSIPTSNFFTI